MAETDQFPDRGDKQVAGLLYSPDHDPDGNGLALSGGGYKAAANHPGGPARLNEHGWLKRIDQACARIADHGCSLRVSAMRSCLPSGPAPAPSNLPY